MSVFNNYRFSRLLDEFNKKVILQHEKLVEKAEKIMADENYKWDSLQQKERASARLKDLQELKEFYRNFYDEGLKFCVQHENLTNLVVKWYNTWREDISYNGMQEKEMMTLQADMLHDIFSEMYKEIKVLNVDVKEPKALNLK
jgi:hypothetical protein